MFISTHTELECGPGAEGAINVWNTRICFFSTLNFFIELLVKPNKKAFTIAVLRRARAMTILVSLTAYYTPVDVTPAIPLNTEQSNQQVSNQQM